jgi:hypothetical protein
LDRLNKHEIGIHAIELLQVGVELRQIDLTVSPGILTERSYFCATVDDAYQTHKAKLVPGGAEISNRVIPLGAKAPVVFDAAASPAMHPPVEAPPSKPLHPFSSSNKIAAPARGARTIDLR